MKSAVITTRVRLARNLNDYPFPVRMTQAQKQQLCDKVYDAVKDIMEFDRIDMDTLSQSQAIALVERHLISPDFVKNTAGKTLLVSKDKSVAIMLNEEDHIRLQVIKSGLCLSDVYAIADEIDDKMSQKLSFAYSEKLGYLTQCPTSDTVSDSRVFRCMQS